MALLTRSGITGELPAARDLGPLVLVHFYMAHSVVTGLLRLQFHRLSDQLNYGPPLQELVQAELSRRGHDPVHRSTTGALVQRSSVLLAVDQVSSDYSGSVPALRQDKTPLQITADLGHFVVSGTLLVRPGTDILTWLADAPLFVPLTGVTIEGHGAEPLVERRAIVNRSMLAALLF